MHWALVRYNSRICTGVGPWLIVVPVAGSMLVLFALMAMTSLIRAATPVLVLELLGPILLAFVGVNLLRPEYQYRTLETVLTRPVSFRVILTVRVLFAAVAVMGLQALLCLYMRTVMDKEFDAGLALLAAAASVAFLTSLAVAVAATWRSPTLGFGAAAAFWALDLVAGPKLNPLLTLSGYSSDIARPDEMWEHWWVGKLVLCAVALLLVVVAARAARQPTAQRSARRWARAGMGVLLVALLYVGSGAAYKVEWGRGHEAKLLNHTRWWYQQAFEVYGPAPVAYLFGPCFARYVGYRSPWTELPSDPSGEMSDARFYDVQQLKAVAFGHPTSMWADNALLELGRLASLDDRAATGPSPSVGEGIRCLELLASDHPRSPFAPLALERLVHVYEQMGRRGDSLDRARRLLNLYPTTAPAQSAGRAVLERLSAEQRREEALWVAEKLAQGASEDGRPSALVALAYVLADLGRFGQAQSAFAEAVKAADERARALASAGDEDMEARRRLRELSQVRRRAAEGLESLRESAAP